MSVRIIESGSVLIICFHMLMFLLTVSESVCSCVFFLPHLKIFRVVNVLNGILSICYGFIWIWTFCNISTNILYTHLSSNFRGEHRLSTQAVLDLLIIFLYFVLSIYDSESRFLWCENFLQTANSHFFFFWHVYFIGNMYRRKTWCLLSWNSYQDRKAYKMCS